MADAPPIQYAQNGDVSIAYAVDGSGPIDLLFVSGFVGNLDIALSTPLLQPFWDRLRSFARVVWFDKRGQGLSDRAPYTLEDTAADAIAVIDAAGLDRVSVFGVSEGGSACTMLAATYPDRIDAMVQYGTYARLSQADDYPEGVPAEVLEQTWKRVTEDWGTGASIEIFAPSEAANTELRELWTRLLRSGASPSSMRTISEMYVSQDIRPLLSGITAPTLVLWRGNDRLIPPRFSKVVAEGIPNSRAVELEGSDHLFFAGDTGAMLDQVEEFLTGRRPTRVPERILATVLFVDIVESTSRAAELGDRAWRELLERCERAWRREVARQGGTFVKWTGDGLLATCEGPSRAAAAALAIRDAGAALGVETRAGVHTGELERNDDDIAGIAVHIASRVEGEAAPGTVAATTTVRDLSIGSGLRFDEIGERSLKGVPGEWRLYEVSAA